VLLPPLVLAVLYLIGVVVSDGLFYKFHKLLKGFLGYLVNFLAVAAIFTSLKYTNIFIVHFQKN